MGATSIYFYNQLRQTAASVNPECVLLTANPEYCPNKITHKNNLPEIATAYILGGTDL